MRTNEARIHLVRVRTAQCRRRRLRLLTAVCTAASLLLVAGVGLRMPELMARASSGDVLHATGAASLIADHAALGYILMGLLSFLLGVCVTLILLRLRRRPARRRWEGDDEL